MNFCLYFSGKKDSVVTVPNLPSFPASLVSESLIIDYYDIIMSPTLL